ncbi:DsbE family thiol:disulfide interchange protein [Candidatus Pelagibacter bacterium nBUS_27]|uniref:DsbE family thiol:disulfide interchange protein n=1 Tax=Candidatus Pelagibacter bacterium nBUS_27 TaxID=3374188 RepID=UPI003EBB236A|tara:strand:- start:232 stop:750 length:519 start_codon:yes stop_codon:yes gene_type:complete
MKNKLLPFSIVLIFITIFIIFYKGLQDTNIYTPEVKTNYEVPSVSVELFDSGKIVNTLEIFNTDKFYLLNIWSSWCVPCRQEHLILMDLIKNDNLKIIGINYKDTKKNAKKFLEELGNPYDKIIFDNDGTNAIEWGAYGVPESFLINKNKIIKKYIGPLSKESMEEIKLFIK